METYKRTERRKFRTNIDASLRAVSSRKAFRTKYSHWLGRGAKNMTRKCYALDGIISAR